MIHTYHQDVTSIHRVSSIMGLIVVPSRSVHDGILSFDDDDVTGPAIVKSHENLIAYGGNQTLNPHIQAQVSMEVMKIMYIGG